MVPLCTKRATLSSFLDVRVPWGSVNQVLDLQIAINQPSFISFFICFLLTDSNHQSISVSTLDTPLDIFICSGILAPAPSKWLNTNLHEHIKPRVSAELMTSNKKIWFLKNGDWYAWSPKHTSGVNQIIYFLRAIPTLIHYSDILSDIPSGNHSFWHILWHSFWHSIWHLFWHTFWHNIFWHSFWHSI